MLKDERRMERRKTLEKPLLDGSSDSIVIRFPGLYDMPAQAAPQPGGPYRIRLPPGFVE